MEESYEETQRVSGQISSLSTQLIESIDKQSQLEEKLNQARRVIQSQKSSIEKYEVLKQSLEDLNKKAEEKEKTIQGLLEDIEREKGLRITAQDSVEELNKEIEDLTASLFDEANNMVATARRESHAVQIKNTKLIEQLHERDSILETLNLQLKNLKKVFQNLENETSTQSNLNRGSLIVNDTTNSSSISLNKSSTANSNRVHEQNLGPIYSPNITSIRYDLSLYTEFLKFIAILPHCESIKETASESKLLRRLVNDEIQPVLRLDNASGLGWIVRRTLMSLMMEGLVVVEPLSGLNENYQFGYASPPLVGNAANTSGNNVIKDSHLFHFPSDSPPIAVHDKCSFCAESRDDIIEHARMYVLKTQSKADDGSLIVTNTFPLCKYCVLKVRQTCEIFAFLRSLMLGAWSLEKVTLSTIAKGDSKRFSEISKSEKDVKKDDKKSQRISFMAGINSLSKPSTQVEAPVGQTEAPTTNIQRAWLQLCKLRCTLHWTHIGIWSIEDSIGSKIGPLTNENDESDVLSIEEYENFELRKVTSEEGSFSLKKRDEDDSADEMFVFENRDNSLATVEPSVPNEQEEDYISSDDKKTMDDVVLRINEDQTEGRNVNSDKLGDEQEAEENKVGKNLNSAKLEHSGADILGDLDKITAKLKEEIFDQPASAESGIGAELLEKREEQRPPEAISHTQLENNTLQEEKTESEGVIVHQGEQKHGTPSENGSVSNQEDHFDDAQEEQ